MHDPIHETIGVKTAVLVLGFLGSLIQLYLNPTLGKAGSFISVIAGMSCAIVLTPLFSAWVQNVPAAEFGLAFFFGLSGMQLTQKAHAFVKDLTVKQILEKVLQIFSSKP